MVTAMEWSHWLAAAILWRGSFAGSQKVTQRRGACNCGCRGRDPWHRQSITRVVRDVRVLAEPIEARDVRGRSLRVIALATIAHPCEEMRTVGLEVLPAKWGAAAIHRWIVIDGEGLAAP